MRTLDLQQSSWVDAIGIVYLLVSRMSPRALYRLPMQLMDLNQVIVQRYALRFLVFQTQVIEQSSFDDTIPLLLWLCVLTREGFLYLCVLLKRKLLSSF